MTTLYMRRGDTRIIDVTVTDETGALVDLSTSTLRFTAKRRYQDEDMDAVIAKESGDGISLGVGTGEAVITIEPEDTEDLNKITTLQWDFQVTDSTMQVQTPAWGLLVVNPDISVTTP